jgi:hypothetical protein
MFPDHNFVIEPSTTILLTNTLGSKRMAVLQGQLDANSKAAECQVAPGPCPCVSMVVQTHREKRDRRRKRHRERGPGGTYISTGKWGKYRGSNRPGAWGTDILYTCLW